MQTPHDAKSSFWNTVWKGDESALPSAWVHPLLGFLEGVIQKYDLKNVRVLEIGCGSGGLQTVAADYTGTDIASACGRYLRSPARFVCCPATALPLADDAFDFVFSIYTLEHIADVEKTLEEVRRVVRPGGIVLLKPAWFCRPWNGRPWFHKSYRDRTTLEKLLHCSVRIRNSLPYRAVDLFQWRLRGLFNKGGLRRRKLIPNYDRPDVIDADAEVWLDPLDVINWFLFRGDECLSHPTLLQRWGRTSDAVIVRIQNHYQRSA